jgi:CheY-like chemotaxis protein
MIVGKCLVFLKRHMTFPKTLVAEDDPNDALLLHCAFKRAGIDATIHFVSDGVEAIDYLRGKQLFEKVASSTLPGMFLLDLEMPRLSGFGVLEWLRKHPHLRPYRVVVFSSSENEQEMARAREMGADLCLSKTCSPIELAQVIKTIHACFYSQPPQSLPGPERNEFALLS